MCWRRAKDAALTSPKIANPPRRSSRFISGCFETELLTDLLAGGDPRAVLALFGPECFWRDLVAFTWNLRTEEGPVAIGAMLTARLADVAPHAFELRGEAIKRTETQLRLPAAGRPWTITRQQRCER